MSDAAWIADLLAHGLIRSSFVPPASIQELRDLTRTRKLVREISQHSSRIQKILEDANLKLGSVLSDVLGRSGRAILQALSAGETNPERLADLARGTARKKRSELIEALHGRIRAHHRGLLEVHLELVAALEQALTDIDAAVGKNLAPIQQSARLLTTMPGVPVKSPPMSSWRRSASPWRASPPPHTCCPGPPSVHATMRAPVNAALLGCAKAAPGLRPPSLQPPWAAVRVRGSYLQAQFLRLKARRGAKKTILAVAASMLTAAYHMLKDGVEYHELGADHFTRRDRSKAISRLVRRLNDLGCQVQLTPQTA